jgi:hypothetical protein
MAKKKRQTVAEIIREHYMRIGKKGGKAWAEKLTSERSKEIADQGARKRWGKKEGEV